MEGHVIFGESTIEVGLKGSAGRGFKWTQQTVARPCIAGCATLCWSLIFTDLHFIEGGTAEKSWHSGWSWSLLLTRANSAEAWRLLMDPTITDLSWVTLLNLTAGILATEIVIAPENYF